MSGAFLEPVRSVRDPALTTAYDQLTMGIFIMLILSGVLQAAMPEVSGGV